MVEKVYAENQLFDCHPEWMRRISIQCEQLEARDQDSCRLCLSDYVVAGRSVSLHSEGLYYDVFQQKTHH